MTVSKYVLSLVLIICILGVQTTPGYSAFSSSTSKLVRVAYLGMYYEGVKSEQQSAISTRISTMIKKEEQLYYVSEDEIESKLNIDLRKQVNKELQIEDFRKAAEQLNVDHIFAGNLQNQSNNEDYTALAGNIVRYDMASNRLYSISIKSFYENFEQELGKIDLQLIQTIVPKKSKGFFARYLPGIIIVAATVAAAALLLGGTSGQGSGGGGQNPPFTAH